MIYLACPYTSLTPEQRDYYFSICCKIAAVLFNEGEFVFAPIVYAHPIASQHKLPPDWHFWAEFDEKLLSICDEIWILQLPGWETSFGILEEIKIAKRLGITVKYIDPGDYGIRVQLNLI